MRIQQFTNTNNIKTSLMIAASTLAIGISAAPAGAVSFTGAGSRLDFGISNGEFQNNVKNVTGDSFQVTFNQSNAAIVFPTTQGSFLPTFVPGTTVGTNAPVGTFVYDPSSTATNFVYKLNSDLLFSFSNNVSLTIKQGALFSESKPTTNSTSFTLANGSTPVSFFTSGADITNNNTLAFKFDDTGAGSGGIYTVSASPTASVPEPFTIIGSIIGGAAALRMKKKMSKSVED
jgi:hypothetical protein